ncbi:MAG TPA: diacylglycerol kinase family protein [Anaerolineales bacterium]|nr:diacylglycerol kinase family protein [Anaerolineales bacterium]
MKAKVILNPYSARWKAGERQAEIEAALAAAGVAYSISASDSPGHAILLALEAVREGFNPILAAGGDGTISEVVNGLLTAEAGENVVFGIVPLGTANDLADNLGWPKDLNLAAEKIAAGKTRSLDVCSINGRYFINNAGLGLEPHISTIQVRMKNLRGILRYLAAALKGILDNPQWDMELEWDGGSYAGPTTLVSIGNCARTGGIFYTVPHADPHDGKLTFIHGHIASRLRILQAFPMIMKSGKGNISEHPRVSEVHATRLSVRIPAGSPAHADGEVIAANETRFEFRVYPGRLKILSA